MRCESSSWTPKSAAFIGSLHTGQQEKPMDSAGAGERERARERVKKERVLLQKRKKEVEFERRKRRRKEVRLRPLERAARLPGFFFPSICPGNSWVSRGRHNSSSGLVLQCCLLVLSRVLACALTPSLFFHLITFFSLIFGFSGGRGIFSRPPPPPGEWKWTSN